jgi:hypothetical protein
MKNVVLVGLLSVSLVTTVLVAGNVATSNRLEAIEREHNKNRQRMADIIYVLTDESVNEFNTLSRRNEELKQEWRGLQ